MSTLGVVLVVVGAALMVAEAHVPTHGLLATAATAALAAGLVLAAVGRRRARWRPCVAVGAARHARRRWRSRR